MHRKQLAHFQHVLRLAQALIDEGRTQSTVHRAVREEQRVIDMGDVEAAITSRDARVVGWNPNHEEGTTYQIRGRREDGAIIDVVVAFGTSGDDDLETAEMLRIVTTMYPRGQ